MECRARQPLAAAVGFGGRSHQLPEPCPALPSPPTLNTTREFQFSQPGIRLSRDENCSTSTGASFCSRLYFRTAGDGHRAVAAGSRGGNKTTSPAWRLPVDWCTVGNSHHQHCSALHYTSLHCNVLHCTILHCTALHYIALHCSALHLTAPHHTALHFTALQCTTLQCTTSLIALH